MTATRRGWPFLSGGERGSVRVDRAHAAAAGDSERALRSWGVERSVGREHPAYLPRHFGGRFSVKAAWNSA
ncbi:hypothetical protein GCM10023238_07080 [Streptomyces heliomycini]